MAVTGETVFHSLLADLDCAGAELVVAEGSSISDTLIGLYAGFSEGLDRFSARL